MTEKLNANPVPMRTYLDDIDDVVGKTIAGWEDYDGGNLGLWFTDNSCTVILIEHGDVIIRDKEDLLDSIVGAEIGIVSWESVRKRQLERNICKKWNQMEILQRDLQADEDELRCLEGKRNGGDK